jgi:hypothetical protein
MVHQKAFLGNFASLRGRTETILGIKTTIDALRRGPAVFSC